MDACEALATILASLIGGKSLRDVLSASYGPFCPGVQAVMDGSYKGKARSEIRSSGYVIHTLEAALWCLSETSTFRDAVLLAFNLGDDADTIAAVTGQIAGALYGITEVPKEWYDRLAWNHRLAGVAGRTYGAELN
ncbi:ADP-ribosylglycohydrolase family protein [Methylobacterium sp. PvR107]|uniref:ADP-ribosylglycohydrolase family protein n=1 Tax=Methylobacterium sp. PvR107 TaxID=2806597 RepID=UPI0028A80C15|nr:ADP-ribosylglycohydrolase family protein [Methylobacterium sp. PvR107]